MYRLLDKSAELLARGAALIGGIVLVALVIVTTASVLGRSLTFIGLNQVKGDFELVELGVGFAIFSFLPWTQYMRGHARVDLFASSFPLWLNRVMDVVSDLLIFSIAVIIGWRLWLGMLDKQSYGETTFILQFPIWLAYLAGVFGMVAFVLVSFVCVLRSLREFGAKA